MEELEVGDVVKLYDSGHCYTTYTRMAKKMKLPNYETGRGAAPYLGKTFMVVAKEPHSVHSRSIVYGIDNGRASLITGPDGIKKMNKFSIGDEVVLSSRSVHAGDPPNPPAGTRGKVTNFINANEYQYEVTWENGHNNHYTERCLDSTELTLEVENLVSRHSDKLVCGLSEIRKAKRRHRDGSEQYVISYEGRTPNAVVRKQDIPNLLVGLMEVMDGKL